MAGDLGQAGEGILGPLVLSPGGLAAGGAGGPGLPPRRSLRLSFGEQFCFDLASNLQLQQESFA